MYCYSEEEKTRLHGLSTQFLCQDELNEINKCTKCVFIPSNVTFSVWASDVY